MKQNHYIVIMAGGIGSRFWPASTKEYPKQFLDILGTGKSLLRLTYERVNSLIPKDRILVVTNKNYVHIVKEHIPEIRKNQILGEPSMNNTAPTVAWAALHLHAINPNAIFAVLPSDHVILDKKLYLENLTKGFEFAENNTIITLGIKPTRPDTGYGYIELGNSVKNNIFKVQKFREKPNLSTAQSYLQSGNYLWNAGMFVWSVKTILNSFETHAPQILNVLSTDTSYYGKESETEYINEVYPKTNRISIDFAILEKSDNVYTIPSDIGWSDLGTWNSLHAYLEKDNNQNVVQGQNIHLYDSNQCIIRGKNSKTIIVKGLEDYIIIDEDHALLIYPKSDEQEIKELVKSIFK